jgi:hypothetical protein
MVMAEIVFRRWLGDGFNTTSLTEKEAVVHCCGIVWVGGVEGGGNHRDT